MIKKEHKTLLFLVAGVIGLGLLLYLIGETASNSVRQTQMKQDEVSREKLTDSFRLPEGAVDIKIIDQNYCYFTLDDRKYLFSTIGNVAITQIDPKVEVKVKTE